MIVLSGKYNKANVMLDELEEHTRNQIHAMLDHPAFANSYISIMPDCHAGAGAVIGLTMKMNDYIIPNIVGVDIGCGVFSVNLGKVDIDLKGLDKFIRENIPSGFNKRREVFDLSRIANDFPFREDIEKMSAEIGSNNMNNQLSLGTLGGGNHFIEVGIDEEENKWLTIHSGSRKFGLDIACYHQKKAKELMKLMFIEDDKFKNLEFLPMDLGGREYLQDMELAQIYAATNRYIITFDILNYLEIVPKSEVESVHNYIDLEEDIIRKGAIRACEGEPLIIPFNMEDGLIIGEGKSNKKWNYSAPHGAGRVYSRRKAKEVLNLTDSVNSMKEKGIYTTSLSKNTLDECKGAYKDKDLIINAITETVDIKHFVRPIYNFKAN